MLPGILLAVCMGGSPAVTELRRTPHGWELFHHGRPFYVKGAGAPIGELQALKNAGANTVRTWGVGADTQALVDRAQKVGLKVILGMWVRKDPQFSYARESDIKAQRAHALEIVQKYRNHPAVLMYAVGNEMELGGPWDHIWKEVETLVKIFKKNDPSRPVMTVVADMWPDKMKAILKECPSLDLLGVNSYAGLPSLETRMKDWTKPYMITEYAFSAPDDLKDPASGLKVELDSTAKAASTEKNYKNSILGRPGRVLGSCFFYWSRSDSQTAGMFNSHLKTGEKLEVVDRLTRLWSGRSPKNLSPSFRSAKALNGAQTAWEVQFSDPEKDRLSLTLEVIREKAEGRFAGDQEQAQPVVSVKAIQPRFTLPTGLKPGSYRAVVLARDGHGGAAVWNHPFAQK